MGQAASLPSTVPAPTLAFSFDDGPQLETTPLMSPAERNQALLDALALHQADLVYQLQPERAAPGQSLLLSMARSLGAGKFEGWERLVDDGDFEVEALKKRGIE